MNRSRWSVAALQLASALVAGCSAGDDRLVGELCEPVLEQVWADSPPEDGRGGWLGSVEVTPAGDVIFGGTEAGVGVVRSYSPGGQLLWEAALDGWWSVDELALHDDGSIGVVGTFVSLDPEHGEDIAFGRLDPQGRLSFEVVHGGDGTVTPPYPTSDLGADILARADGSAVVVGREHRAAGFFPFVRAVSPQGHTLWDAAFEEEGTATTIVEAGGDDIIVAGANEDDAWLARLSADGRTLWRRSALSGPYIFVHDAVVGADGTIVLAGYTLVTGWVSAYSPEGERLWVVHLSGRDDEQSRVYSLALMEEGRLAVLGDSFTPERGGRSWLKVLDLGGEPLWERQLLATPNGFGRIFDFAIDSDTLYAAGDEVYITPSLTGPWAAAYALEACSEE